MGLELTAASLIDRIEAFEGWTNATPEQRAWAMERVNDGYARVLSGVYVDETGGVQAHDWSWLHPWATLALVADDAEYDLPADFGGMDVGPVYQADDDEALPELRAMTPEALERYRDAHPTDADPERWALVPKALTPATGQRWELHVAPTPSAARTLKYRYRVEAAALTDAAVYPAGPPEVHRLIDLAAKAACEQVQGLVAGVHEARFQDEMRKLALADARRFATAGRVEQLTDVDTGM